MLRLIHFCRWSGSNTAVDYCVRMRWLDPIELAFINIATIEIKYGVNNGAKILVGFEPRIDFYYRNLHNPPLQRTEFK